VGGARRSRGSPADLQDLSFELLRPICRADLISPLRHYLTSERGEGVKFVKDCNRKKKKNSWHILRWYSKVLPFGISRALWHWNSIKIKPYVV
jgi:hypothetical protein